MGGKWTAAEILAWIREPHDTFPCTCGATIHVFYDRPALTYRHGEGEALFVCPDVASEDDAGMARMNELYDAWLDRVHAYETNLTEC